MPEDYYSNPDDPDAVSESVAETQSDKNEPDEKDESDSETFLAPKSAFGSYKCKVGDVKKFEVVHEYEDEVELKYLGKESKAKSEEGPSMDKANMELDKMAM